MDLSFLIAPGLTSESALLLVFISALTSAMTAAFGIGGGVVLLAVMAPLVPIAALVPVHGVVQLGSNAGRTLILARSARGRYLVLFVIGASLGVAAGALVVTDLPETVLKLCIGVFVLWTSWGRLPVLAGRTTGAIVAGGGLSSLLTMFVGATGPFVIALFRQTGLVKQALVATTAAAMMVQHGLKVVAFGVLGFDFAAWIGLMAAMIAAGFVGTWIGTRLLARMPEDAFKTVLKVILTIIGLQLVVSSAVAMVS